MNNTNRIIKETIREYDQYGRIIKETIRETYNDDPYITPNVPYSPLYPIGPQSPSTTPHITWKTPEVTCLC